MFAEEGNPYKIYEDLRNKTHAFMRKFREMEEEANALMQQWSEALHTLHPIFTVLQQAVEMPTPMPVDDLSFTIPVSSKPEWTIEDLPTGDQRGDMEPKTYWNRNTGDFFDAMMFGGSNVSAMAVYQWVEANTSGSFDVNSPDDPIPDSGVSIDASDGQMVIARQHEVIKVPLGSYVVKDQDEFFIYTKQAFLSLFEPVA